MFTALNRFCRDKRASVAVTFALSTLPVIGLTGAAVDYGRAANNQTVMQRALDQAALTAILIPGNDEALRKARATHVFSGSFPPAYGAAVEVVESTNDALVLEAQARMPTLILGAVGFVDGIELRARAAATKLFRGPPPCVLALNTRESETLRITGSSDFLARNCVLHSNSTHETGMMLDSNTAPRASGFCSVGGVRTSRVVTPTPRSGCSPMADPFETLVIPRATRCDHRNVTVDPRDTAHLRPGTYCGGLALKGRVTLEPGVYVIEGLLEITSHAHVTGDGVSFALTGNRAGFSIDAQGTVVVRAPRSGPYGGILVMQDRLSNPGFENRLAGGAASVIEGALYTPTQRITMAGGAGFGQNTDYMPIIADRVRISGSNDSKLDVDGVEMAFDLPNSESGARLTQ